MFTATSTKTTAKKTSSAYNEVRLLSSYRTGARAPNDRARAYALWEGWHGYDRQKYAELLCGAFEPFEQFSLKSPPIPESSDL